MQTAFAGLNFRVSKPRWEAPVETADCTELAGRIEGVSRAVLLLTAMLDEARIIDGPRYAEALRRSGSALDFPQPHRNAARRTLQELARTLEAMRRFRQESGDRAACRN